MTPLVAFVIFLAGSCHAAQRIAGGEPATIEDYPTLVQVDSFNRWTEVWAQSCAGTIINNLNILSAAHCFHGSSYDVNHRRIRAGATYRNTGGVVIYVSKEVNNPSFDPETLDNDVTVVRLADALTFSDTIQPGAIPVQGATVIDDLPVEQTGWGLTAADQQASPVLLTTEVFTINNAVCRESYSAIGRVVTSNMICSGLQGGGRGACGADAGGPLSHGRAVLGLVSWAEGCGHEAYPSVNAAVAPHTDWIVSTAEAASL